MPTQLLSPARIAELYGHVEDFVAPDADHPVSKGMASGTITDDTEQALLLGRILVESGERFDHRRWVNALLDWERDVKARGSYDLLGPSTKRAIDAINDGVPPEEAGRSGAWRCHAHRPVGIMMPWAARRWSPRWRKPAGRRTTPRSRSARRPVAAAVSCGVAGGDWRAFGSNRLAAKRGAAFGRWTTGGDIAARRGGGTSAASLSSTASDRSSISSAPALTSRNQFRPLSRCWKSPAAIHGGRRHQR
jgi:hypothetical protein